MQLINSNDKYGLMAISLHWLIALLMIGLLIVGLYMADLPIGLQKLKLYGLHKEFGLLVLLLACIRLFWRLRSISPELSAPWWETLSARAVHWLFYGFMFGLPLTGWLMSSAAGLPPSFFGMFTLPNLIAPNETYRILFENIHGFLAYSLIVLILLHTAAALKHHFINKDTILRRMFP